MNNLIDVWFTQEQLKTILHSLQEYYHYCNDPDQKQLIPIMEHLNHLIEHYKNEQ